MNASYILNNIGLTREQVEEMTKDFRPTYTNKMPSEDAGEFAYNWLKKWGSIRYSRLTAMLGEDAGKVVAKWNEDNPDKEITHDEIPLGGGSFINFFNV